MRKMSLFSVGITILAFGLTVAGITNETQARQQRRHGGCMHHICNQIPGETPWSSTEAQYPDIQYDWEFAWANMGYEFTPKVDGYLFKVGGSFHGAAQITLWENVRDESGIPTADPITTVSLDNSDNPDYAWSFVKLTTPIPLKTGNRYAITVYGAIGVFLKVTLGTPEELEVGDIIIHHGTISEPNKEPTDYPEYMMSWHIGHVDISFTPEDDTPCLCLKDIRLIIQCIINKLDKQQTCHTDDDHGWWFGKRRQCLDYHQYEGCKRWMTRD